ncbi:uncharacterized protein LOC116264528 [Nymphaea colorata]|nr:uncharacterized protein LOC116264528 [Nymphaea colorata]
MEKDDPWECLDVDDSDLQPFVRPSTLLPSKRPLEIPDAHLEKTGKHVAVSLHSAPSTQLPSLEPCSQRIRAPFQSEKIQEESLFCSIQNVDANQENSAERAESEEIRVHAAHDLGNNLRFRHRIPGPAGAVQLAMQKDSEVGGERSCHPQDGVSFDLMGCHEDEDFKKSPWLLAVDFVEKQQSQLDAEGASRTTPIKLIKSIAQSVDRLPQVVGILKSCMPDGRGNMFVTLKDPTGTVDASIHRKVIEEDKFGKYISVGSVIILHQVVVFCPGRSSRYLNITLNNVIKVISKECCSAREISSPARTCLLGNREALAGVTESQNAITMKNAQLNQGNRGQQVSHVEAQIAHVVRKEIPIEKLKHNVNMFNCQLEGAHEMQTCRAAVAENSGLHLNSSKDKTAGVKKLIGTSLAEWTDEQINELFNDYQDIF